MAAAALAVVASMLAACGADVLHRASISDGRKVEYSRYGRGRPAIVFLSGLGNTMDTWKSVYWNVRGMSTVVIYNRLGYGRSTKSREPRTAERIVAELREFLPAAGYEPPYLLVAHSAGGLYALYYAKAHPEEIAGMVLVDASHWEQAEFLKNQDPKKDFLTSVLSAVGSVAMLFVDTGMAKEEFAALEESSRQVVEAGPFPDVPLVVISGTKHGSTGPISEERWQAWQQELVALSPQGKLVLATKSGHFVQNKEPGLIVQAIKDVYAEAAASGPSKSKEEK
ncbi:MAG: alpha/beta hydrolase [Candidatus Aminicenantes bacterium]|nr:alpha/beta hydrolase [Candidatus Aminicenantes bacterium]